MKTRARTASLHLNAPTLEVERRRAFIFRSKVGLIFVPLFLVMSFVAPKLPPQHRAGMMVFGVGFALFMPVLYAVMGFVSGVIGAGIYNLVAKWMGGIEVDIEAVEPNSGF
jgi:hypothetical protein